jgi:hypothetical protein
LILRILIVLGSDITANFSLSGDQEKYSIQPKGPLVFSSHEDGSSRQEMLDIYKPLMGDATPDLPSPLTYAIHFPLGDQAGM